MHRTEILVVVCFVFFVDAVSYGIVVPIIPIYCAQLGASNVQLGMIFATYSLMGLFMTMPLGALSDKFGRKPFLLLAMFEHTASSVWYSMSSSVLELIACRLIQGLATIGVWTAGLALVADVFPQNRRGEKMGVVGFATGLGYMAGPVIGGILHDLSGYKAPFYTLSLLSAIVGLYVLVRLRQVETKKEHGRETTRQRESIWELFRTVLSNRNLLFTSVLVVMLSLDNGFLEPFYPKYLAGELGWTESMIGFLFGICVYGVYTFIQPLVGKISDVAGRKPPIVVGYASCILIFSLLAPAKYFLPITILMALYGCAQGAVYAVVPALIADSLTTIRKEEAYGTAQGLYLLSYQIGYFIGPLIGGILVGLAGIKSLFHLYAVMAGIGALMANLFLKDPIKQ